MVEKEGGQEPVGSVGSAVGDGPVTEFVDRGSSGLGIVDKAADEDDASEDDFAGTEAPASVVEVQDAAEHGAECPEPGPAMAETDYMELGVTEALGSVHAFENALAPQVGLGAVC